MTTASQLHGGCPRQVKSNQFNGTDLPSYLHLTSSLPVLSANPSPTTPTSSHLLYSLTLNPLLPSPTSSPSSSTSQPSQPSLALTDFATGSDSDIGGLSTCTLDFDENGDGRFWGEMRTGVRGEFRGKVRGGYAGFRNKVCTVLIQPTWLSLTSSSQPPHPLVMVIVIVLALFVEPPNPLRTTTPRPLPLHPPRAHYPSFGGLADFEALVCECADGWAGAVRHTSPY